MSLKRFIRFRTASLLLLTAAVAAWTAATVRPLGYIAAAQRVRELGGRVALADIETTIGNVPYLIFCRATNRSPSLPSVLALDERCPAAAPVLEVAGKILSLTSLDLTRSDVDEHSFKHLSRLRRVQHIRLQGRPIRDASMSIVGRWRGLRSASFQGTQITDIGVAKLANCVQLEELSLRSTSLTDGCVDVLIKLKHLNRLDVSRCGLSPKAIQRLREALPDCKINTRDPWDVEAEQWPPRERHEGPSAAALPWDAAS